MTQTQTAVTVHSWDLKLARAYQRLRELESRIGDIAPPDRRPIRVEKEHRDGQWWYSAHCDLTVDEMLPVVIGEFLFNLRSALDHIAVANVPEARKREAQFPIFTQDLWKKDSNGNLTQANASARKTWKDYTQGMSAKVAALIEWAQPYNALKQSEDPETKALAILNTLQNADKHRELTIVARGIVDPVFEASNGQSLVAPLGLNQMIPDGAEIFSLPYDVDVEMEGIVKVAMKRGRANSHLVIPETLTDLRLEIFLLVGAIVKEM